MIEDLAETDEQRAFGDVARRCFERCAGLSPEDIARRIAEDGILAMLAPEAAGGLGLGLRAVLPVAREAGRRLLAFPLVEAMLANQFAARRAAMPGADIVAAGGFATLAWGGAVDLRQGGAHGVAACAPAAEGARFLVFRALRDGRKIAAMVDLQGRGVAFAASESLDLDRIYADVILSDAPAVAVGDWRNLAESGAILRAADMLGAAEASFAETCAHVSTRRQFGKPLAAQQTVAAALARDHFALAAAALSVEYAAFSADAGQDDAATARDVACSVAQDACVGAAETAIQLHGALGFTAEMPLHRRLRRIHAAGDIYPARAARATLAQTLLDSWLEAA